MTALQPKKGAVYMRRSDGAQFVFKGDPDPEGTGHVPGYPPFYRGWVAIDGIEGRLVGQPGGWPHGFTEVPPAPTLPSPVPGNLDERGRHTHDGLVACSQGARCVRSTVPWRRPPQPSLRDAIVAEDLDRAKRAALVFASTLKRSPSKRELTAFLSGFMAAVEEQS